MADVVCGLRGDVCELEVVHCGWSGWSGWIRELLFCTVDGKIMSAGGNGGGP